MNSCLQRPAHCAPHLLAGLLAGVISNLSAAQTDPAAELASFQIAEGFECNLFASEANGVVKPIQIRFDTRGRLWVIGSTVYPQIEPGQLPDDKVLILEDTDGDGRCDQTTVFAEGLMIPTGIEIGDGGAYVGHGTELLFLKDTDGDDRADERRVLFRGFGTGDNHQNINSFLFGPGGELWMSQGLHTRSSVETAWGIVRVEQAGLWRLWPRRLKLEGFYGSVHEPQNPWGFVFTDWGESIVLAGNNSSPIYPVPGLVPNRRSDAPPLIWKNGNGRKVSGGDIVGTTHFPDAWQGALIVGGYINNAVWALRVRDDGAGFALEDLPPLIRSTDRSFRPVDVKFGPDGALYVCDWFNPIIGHYQASFRHPDRDKKHGRIWRITAKGRPLTTRPDLHNAPLTTLLDHLASPDRWTRRFAKRELSNRPRESVLAALDPWSLRPERTDHQLVEALGVFQSHETVSPTLLDRLAQSSEPGARAAAAGAIGPWADRLSNPLETLKRLAADPHPRVRLHAIVSCAHVPSAEALTVAAIASDAPADRFIDYALRQAVFSLKPQWLPALREGRLNFDHHPARLSMLVRCDGTPDTLAALRGLLASPNLDADARAALLQILAEHGASEDFAGILKLEDAQLQARVLPVLLAAARSRNLRPPETAGGELARLIESPDPAVRSSAFKLAGLWRIDELSGKVNRVAQDPNSKASDRRAAIEALGLAGDAQSRALLSGLAASGPVEQRAEATLALAGQDPGNAAAPAARVLSDLTDDDLIADLFTAFLGKTGGARALTEALSKQSPSVRAATTGLRVMGESGRRDAGLAELLTTAAGWTGDLKQLSPAQIDALAADVKSGADARRGESVFRRPELGCVACHEVNGEGGSLGPNLSALGTAQTVEFILGAILDPNKEVKEGYASIEVVTRSGDVFQGYRLREDATELVLRDALQQREIRIRAPDIQERADRGSIMPSGLVDHLSRDELRDLVAYLSELGRP